MNIKNMLESLIAEYSDFDGLYAKISSAQKSLNPDSKNFRYDSVQLDMMKIRYDIACLTGILIEIHGLYIEHAESTERRFKRLESILLTKTAIDSLKADEKNHQTHEAFHSPFDNLAL